MDTITEQLPEVDDPSRDVQLWTLDAEQRRVFEAGFMLGYSTAGPGLPDEVARLRAQLAQAEHAADRYYAEMCRRLPARVAATIPYAELCRRRGEKERAERHEELMRTKFAQTA